MRDLKSKMKKKIIEFKKDKTREEFRRKMKKINQFCDTVREEAKEKFDKKTKWLIKKYTREEQFILPQEVFEFKDLRVFQPTPKMVPAEGQGPVVVCMEGETLPISREEFLLLGCGPDYCVINGCTEEGFRCDIETAIVKEKWDRMGRDEEEEYHANDEERKESERVAQLAEEVAAQSRQAYDSDTKTWSGAGLRVTDYKANTRVIVGRAS